MNGGVTGYDVDVEYAIIKNTILEEQYNNTETTPRHFRDLIQSYIDCFRGPDLWRTIGSTLPICSQQLTGLAFLNVYASLFFRQSGFTNAFLVTTITGMLIITFCSHFGFSLTLAVHSRHLPHYCNLSHPRNRQIWSSTRRLCCHSPLFIRFVASRYPWTGGPNTSFEELPHLCGLSLVTW